MNLAIIYADSHPISPLSLTLLRNYPRILFIEAPLLFLPSENFTVRRVTPVTYLKIRLFELLPKDVERIIYFDSDMLILRNPIKKINRIQLKFGLGAVPIPTLNGSHLGYNFISYFNAGMLMFDNQKYDPSLAINLLSETSDFQKFKYQDQDILNLAYAGNYQAIPGTLNYFPFPGLNLHKVIFPHIIHFVGSNKPWNSNRPTFYHLIWIVRFNRFLRKNSSQESRIKIKPIHYVYVLEWILLHGTIGAIIVKIAKELLFKLRNSLLL